MRNFIVGLLGSAVDFSQESYHRRAPQADITMGVKVV